MTKVLGDIRAQLRWFGTVLAAAAGLQLFSIAGPGGDFIAETLHRIVFGYQAIFTFIWSVLSRVIAIDLLPYKAELTFSALIAVPYVVRWRRLKMSPFSEDRMKLLSFLNLIAVTVIGTSVFSSSAVFTNERWLISISFLPLLLTFFAISLKSYIKELDYRAVLKLTFLVATGVLAAIAVGAFIADFHKFVRIYQPATTLVVKLLENGSYLLGILFRVDGYYPFLIACVFYLVFYSINYFLLYIAPAVTAFLDSIGA